MPARPLDERGGLVMGAWYEALPHGQASGISSIGQGRKGLPPASRTWSVPPPALLVRTEKMKIG